MSAMTLGKTLKGLYSAAVGVFGTVSTILQGSEHFSDLTDGQITTICLVALVAFGGTFGLAGWSGPTTSGSP